MDTPAATLPVGPRATRAAVPAPDASLPLLERGGTLAMAAAATAALAACGGGSEAASPQAMLAPQTAPRTDLLLQAAPAPRATTASSPLTPAPTPDELFDWAERQYPALFDSHPANRTLNGLVYRFYPGTGNYLGVLGTDVLVMGPGTQNEVRNAGTLASFADAIFNTGGPRTDAEAARFLLQAQLSASVADIARLRTTSYAAWLEQQFQTPPGITGWDWLNQRGYAVVDSNNYFDNSYPADYMVWHQLMRAPDPLRKRVALALSEIFVVSTSGIDISWRSHAMAAYWDMLVANAFGSFRKLLEDVTLNPAMGVYLNTRGNQKENPATGRQPDENYAREILQLMSIGLVQLNPDGTPRRDGNGALLDSYTQSDITNLARVFTGYDFDMSQNVPIPVPGSSRTVPNTTYTRLPMALNASRHSTLEARFLGATVPANTPGAAALKTALDTIFHHPNVGPFIGKQLIQRLVTSNPSPAYVARVTAAFNDNGQGQRGDMRAVVRAILLDDEARNPATAAQPTFGKLREPMLRLVQWGRTFNLNSAYGSWKIGNLSDAGTSLGQSPLRSPSVFNFFRPGYVPPSTALAAIGAVAPEFQLVNESSVGGYLNFMQNVVRNGLYANAPDQPNPGSNATNGFDMKPDYSNELALVTDPDALVGRLNLLLCAGQLSAATVRLISDAVRTIVVTPTSSLDTRLNRVAAAVLLVMASAEYLVQK